MVVNWQPNVESVKKLEIHIQGSTYVPFSYFLWWITCLQYIGPFINNLVPEDPTVPLHVHDYSSS